MKAKFGIEGLDNMLNGGLKKGRVYVLSGGMGTGKTLTAIKFLVEGIKEGENCLYISVDKPPQLPIRMAARLKYNVSQLKIMDAVPSPDLYSTGYPVRDITAKGDISFARDTKGEYIGKGELTFEALQIKLNKVFNHTRYDRIVIDSYSTFKRFASDDFKRYIAIQQLFRFFINKGITLMITVDDPEN